MFTGIIEEQGKVASIQRVSNGVILEVSADTVLYGTDEGDSISVNGVCLTVTKIRGGSFFADVSTETLDRSNLGALKQGAAINLERAVQIGGRLGGHIVSGHIDGIAKIVSILQNGTSVKYTFETAKSITDLIVEKGSIAVDGISLTVTEVAEKYFSVVVIPHTLHHTTLQYKTAGATVNLENDIIGKYVQRLLTVSQDTQPVRTEQLKSSRITKDFLAKYGF